MEKIYIVSAKRTAVGNYGGALIGISAEKLARVVLEKTISDLSIDKKEIDEVILGCILQAGLGQNLARQVAVNTGLPIEVPAMTLNQVCGSGLRSVSLGTQIIKAGDREVIIAGGVENMSRAPYLLNEARWGTKMGDVDLKDSMISDALTDSFNKYHMGMTAENIAKKYGISREEQDEFAAFSQEKAKFAIEKGKFKDEIVPISIPQRKGERIFFDTDEFPRFGTTVEKLSKLRPAFEKDGSVTAGNSSGINDGAAIIVLMSERKAAELQIKPIAEVISYASVGVDPKIMGIGPVFSTKLALEKANLRIEDIGLIEANEAFAAQSIAVIREAGFDTDKVNVNGGSIALGHPVGASGARILTTLLYEMKKRNEEYGLATLCVGGGMGVSVIVKNIL